MKKLTLNKKTITNLNNEDLNNVVGGNMPASEPGETCKDTCDGGGGGWTTTIITFGCISQTCFTQCPIENSCICG